MFLKSKRLFKIYLTSTLLILNINEFTIAQDLTASDDLFTVKENTISISASGSSFTSNINSGFGKDTLLIDGTIWMQNYDLSASRFTGLLGAMALSDFLIQKKQSEYWYTKKTVKFHSVDFIQDFKRYKQMDKLGHFTDTYFVSDLTSKAYRWAGLTGESSVWFGALTGWLWTLQIELYDAHSPSWGWSWGDIFANTVGSGFFILQQFNYDLLGGIHPKFSYHLSEEWEKYGSGKTGYNLVQDYAGMTFWIAVNPHHYFPESWKKDYPDWLVPLGIAIGFGVNGVIFNSLEGEREIYIGLDIDMRKINAGNDSGIIRFLKSELNFIRLPLPAVCITPSGVWYGLYF